jgi:hypothetical protein
VAQSHRVVTAQTAIAREIEEALRKIRRDQANESGSAGLE